MQDEDNERAGYALRQLNARRRVPLKNREIAEASGIPLTTINRMLTNRAVIRMGQFVAIAKALGFSGTDGMVEFEKAVL